MPMRFSNQLLCLGLTITPMMSACDSGGPLDLGSRDFGPRQDAGPTQDMGTVDMGTLDAGSLDTGGSQTAADFEGYYRIMSASFSNGPGQPPSEITRDGADSSIRGEFRFAATSASTAQISGKFFLLQENLLDGPITGNDRLIEFDVPAILEADRWVIDPDGGATVYTFTEEDGQLILTFDPTDPRNIDPDDSPPQFILERGTAPDEYSAGQWELVAFEGNNGPELRAGVCRQDTGQPGSSLFRMTMDVAPSTLVYTLDFTLENFSDGACTSSTTIDRNQVGGIFEELDDGTLEQWLIGDDTPSQYLHWNVQMGADTIDLTRADCDPQPFCIEQGPSRMQFRRR